VRAIRGGSYRDWHESEGWANSWPALRVPPSTPFTIPPAIPTMDSDHIRAVRYIVLALLGVGTASCASTTDATTNTTTATDAVSTVSGMQSAKWGSNVTVTFANGTMTYASNGIPNHARQAQYALPNAGVRVPSAATAYAGADPTVAQTYSFAIPTMPTKATTPTSTSLGTIGVMISGAALYNPYEGDGSTVAMASNFTVKNSVGQDIAFLDACNGHPTPFGAYHYHALPPCVTAMVDIASGPSHIIGVAFDGYPIYGDRDLNGKQLVAADLDGCSGITSATPEFPNGIYHYVLLATNNSTSSIRCFSGVVKVSATASMAGMVHP
jgi:hypothetical protein